MNKPNLPDELEPGKRDYSVRKELEVNGWGYVGLALSIGGEALIYFHQDWPITLRTVIALAPIVPALLWGRVFARWVRGMDELHRRMTVEVCLFATTATLFVFTALHPLVKFDVFEASGNRDSWLAWLMDWHSWLLTSWLLICFYMLGGMILRRRFK
jgi:hypothetical protein